MSIFGQMCGVDTKNVTGVLKSKQRLMKLSFKHVTTMESLCIHCDDYVYICVCTSHRMYGILLHCSVRGLHRSPITALDLCPGLGPGLGPGPLPADRYSDCASASRCSSCCWSPPRRTGQRRRGRPQVNAQRLTSPATV